MSLKLGKLGVNTPKGVKWDFVRGKDRAIIRGGGTDANIQSHE